jgi:hypothetical protein
VRKEGGFLLGETCFGFYMQFRGDFPALDVQAALALAEAVQNDKCGGSLCSPGKAPIHSARLPGAWTNRSRWTGVKHDGRDKGHLEQAQADDLSLSRICEPTNECFATFSFRILPQPGTPIRTKN